MLWKFPDYFLPWAGCPQHCPAEWDGSGSAEGEGTSPGAFLGCFEAAFRPLLADCSSHFFYLIFMRCFLEISDHFADPVWAPSFLWALLTPQLWYWTELKWQTHKTKHFYLAGTAGLCHRNPEIQECCWIDMDNPGSNVHFVSRGEPWLWFHIRLWRCWHSLSLQSLLLFSVVELVL